jgi:tetratricopeptide (TPR) repeat protein
MGQYRVAADLLRQSLAIQQRLRPGDKDVARVENDLGVLLYYLDECGESQRLLKDALRFVETNGLRRLVSTVKNNLGLCSLRLANYDEAIALYTEALAVDRQTGGARDLGTANDLTNLGFALSHKARYAEAEPMLLESVAIRRALLSPSHPELSRSLSNLARVLVELGDLERAETAQEEARRIRAALPRGALSVIDNNVDGLLHLASGRLAAAEKSFGAAIALGTEFLGPEHHDTLQAMSALGLTLDRLGRRAEAEALQRKALDIATSRFGPRHALVGLAAARLASLRLGAGRPEEALLLSRQAVEVLSAAHGRDHPRVAEALMVEGAALRKAGRKDDARRAFAEAFRIRALKLRPGNPSIREAETAVMALADPRA